MLRILARSADAQKGVLLSRLVSGSNGFQMNQQTPTLLPLCKGFSFARATQAAEPEPEARESETTEHPYPEPKPMQRSANRPGSGETDAENNSGTPGNQGKGRDLGHMLMYPHYEKEYIESIRPKHKPPEKFYQKTALWAVTAMRWGFDTISGYPKAMNEAKWLQRMIFLETVAGVPGMVGGMLRHMRSLRTMDRDYGWIHTLLEEAENERMHLLTFMDLKHPSAFFRGFVLLTQGVFFNLYTMFYLISPKHCHAFVGYLEEEAVKTYTHALDEIENGSLKGWRDKQPSKIARTYWGLPEESTMRDLILVVRADEYGHSHVNHTFSNMKPGEVNPFEAGAHQVH